MEKEHHSQVVKYSITAYIGNLALLNELLKITKQLLISNDLEIEPFTEFSLPFQAEYWYLKYLLLRDGKLKLELEDFKSLYEERNINIIWLNVTDEKNFVLECKDGNWFVSFIGLNKRITSLFDQFKLTPI